VLGDLLAYLRRRQALGHSRSPVSIFVVAPPGRIGMPFEPASPDPGEWRFDRFTSRSMRCSRRSAIGDRRSATGDRYRAYACAHKRLIPLVW